MSVLSILCTKGASFASSPPDHDLSLMKTVKIGKHAKPLIIMVMAPLDAPTWQKRSCFESLCNNAYDLAGGDHPIADIINLLMEELPNSTTAAFQES